MLDIRPTSIAYIDAASLRLVAELLGKLVRSNREVVPVLTGSVVEFARFTVGNKDPPTELCQLCTRVYVPPMFSRWLDLIHVRLSVRVVTGVLRRDWLEA